MEIAGKKAVVVGRSNIVGMPVALLLTNRDATVTVLHSRTPNAQELCSTADIVVAAIGKPELVKGNWIKEGAAVIDVGTNAVDVGFPCILWSFAQVTFSNVRQIPFHYSKSKQEQTCLL